MSIPEPGTIPRLSQDIFNMETDEVRAAVETAEQNGHRHVREPLVYQVHEPRSFFKDRFLAESGGREAAAAGERLERHKRQMAAVPQETRTFPGANEDTYEYRVNPNLETGHGGEFGLPLWMIEYFAKAPRPGKIIQRLAPTFALPSSGGGGYVASINLPRATAGVLVESSSANTTVAEGEIETKLVKAEAATFSGKSDWPIQALEQSPPGAYLDWAMFVELTDAIDSQVELQLIIGTGKERLPGLYKLSGANEIAAGTEAKIEKIFPAIGKGIAQVGVKRQKPPEAILMNTARLAWLALTSETEQRPLVLTDDVGSEFPSAWMSGIALYLNDNIPNTLGAAKEEDTIIVCRPADMILFMTPDKTYVDLDVLSGTAQVRFLAARYVAAFTHRFPQGVSFLTGTGMIPATGFK